MNAVTLLALAAVAAITSVQPAIAQQFPVKPIRIVVPFTPGGPNDVLARMVGQRLTELWGQQVIVDNRPGGGTVIGSDFVAKAPADGHTLLVTSTSTAVNPSVNRKLPYDTLKDFAPVIRLVASPNVLVAHPALPVKNVADLIRLAKSKPGEIAYASGGTGAATHLAGELVCIMGGVKMTHVPYKGAGPATVDLISGQVQWMFGTIMPTLPHIKTGRLRAIGVTGDKPTAVLPDVPPVSATLKGFDATSWYGIFAPAQTPRAVVTKLNEEIGRYFRLPETRASLAKDGTVTVADTPEEFDRFFRSEVAKWAKVIKQAGIEVQ